jgi:hypothetical protein
LAASFRQQPAHPLQVGEESRILQQSGVDLLGEFFSCRDIGGMMHPADDAVKGDLLGPLKEFNTPSGHEVGKHEAEFPAQR